MKLRHLIQYIVVLTSLLLIVSSADAQMSSEIWITVQSDSAVKYMPDPIKLWFGNHVNATYGIDSLNPTIKEKLMPPLPPCFAAAWANIPGRENIWGGPYLNVYDFRGISSNQLKVDTFNLAFADAINLEADIIIRWPEADYLAQRCDSMFLVEKTGQLPIINAFSVDSIVIPDAGDRNIRYFYIYKYGCKIIDYVNDELINIPIVSELQQNFPNPFNPSTQITYSLPRAADVKLKIYDVLGREITILVNERKSAGTYTANWNAVGIPTGVYFYRIVAGEYVETKKMVIAR